jgi:hypothetical protein
MRLSTNIDRRGNDYYIGGDGYKRKLEGTWVYLIHDLGSGFYKIGKSDNPARRLGQLRSQRTLLPFPHNFVLIEAWRDSPRAERVLHREFAALRIRGEWFDLSDDELTTIRSYFYEAVQYSLGCSAEDEDGLTGTNTFVH